MTTLYLFWICFVLMIENLVIGQYGSEKDSLSTHYTAVPTWYGFFPPPSVRKSAWPQTRHTNNQLKRTMTKKPNFAQLKARDYKLWVSHPPQIKPLLASKILNKRWKPMTTPKPWIQQSVVGKRWGPHQLVSRPWVAPNVPAKRWGPQQPHPKRLPKQNVLDKRWRPHQPVPKLLMSTKTIEKRWGPKYMIVENKPHLALPASDLIKNAKAVTYYPTASENLPDADAAYNEDQHAAAHNEVEAGGKDAEEQTLFPEISGSENRKYSPTNEIYKAFVNTHPIIPKITHHDVTDFYAGKPISKPTHDFIRDEKMKEMREKSSKFDSKKRVLPPSPNPELEKLASNFLDSLSYKRFNALEYLKSNKDYASNVYKKLLEGESNDDISESFSHVIDELPEKGVSRSKGEEKESLPNFMKEKDDLIVKYMQQQGLEKQLLNDRIKEIRDRAIQKYKERHLTSAHAKNSHALSTNLKARNKSSSETKSLKNSSNSKTAHPTTHLDLEENSKHGAHINSDQFLHSRPKLQIGADLHGHPEHKQTSDRGSAYQNDTLTKSDIIDLEEKVRNFKSSLESEPKQYKIKVEGGITTDAKPKPGTSSADVSSQPLKPTVPSNEEAMADPAPTPPNGQFQATMPIIPNLDKPRVQKMPFIKAPQQPPPARPSTAQQTVSSDKQTAVQPEVATEGQGNIVPGQTLVKPFAQKPQIPVEDRIRKPLASDGAVPLTAETTVSPAKGSYAATGGMKVAGRLQPGLKPNTEPPQTGTVVTIMDTKTESESQHPLLLKQLPSVADKHPVSSSTKQAGTPIETNIAISPNSSPISPSEAGQSSVTPPHSENQKLQELVPSLTGIGNKNPVIKRPVAQPCTENECEGNLMKDMKNKLNSLFELLYLRGGNHVVEIYSTGCKGKDCSQAIGKIKFDGMMLGGGLEGMNIVVLGYPGYNFLFSKTYETGKDPIEAAKMVEFLSSLKAPSIVLIVTHGDATSAMTDDAWNILADLGNRGSFIKSPGASLAFIGYKGVDVLPWTQVNQRIAGDEDATSAIFAILGSDSEYITFGGSGKTLTSHIKETMSDQNSNPETRDHGNSYVKKLNTNDMPTSEPSQKGMKVKMAKMYNKNILIGEKATDKIHKNAAKSAKIPLEAEAENEPANPKMTTRDSPHNSKSPSETEYSSTNIEHTAKMHKFDTPDNELKPQQNDRKSSKTSENIGSIPVIVEGERNKTENIAQSFESFENNSPTDKSFEAGLSDSEFELSSNRTTVDEPKEVTMLGHGEDEVKLQDGVQDGNKAVSYVGDDRQTVKLHHSKNETDDKKEKEHHGEHDEHEEVEPHHNATDYHPELPIQRPPDTLHHPDIPEEHIANHHQPSQPFVGRVVNTGHLNPKPIAPNQVYRPHSPDFDGHTGSQLYLPTHGGHSPHHSPGGLNHLGSPLLGPSEDHISYSHPMATELHSDDHAVEVHPVSLNTNEHGSVIAVSTSPAMHVIHDSPMNVHNIDGYNGLSENHHNGYMDHHNYENHRTEEHSNHQLPILNIPHPYVIQSSTPIESHHGDAQHELLHDVRNETEQHKPESDEHHEQSEEHGEHGEHHQAHQKPIKPDNETKSEDKYEKKTPLPITPDIQAKLKEMLAEELTKKLKELKISPDAALKETADKLEKNVAAEKTVKLERKDSATSTKDSTSSFFTLNEKSKNPVSGFVETRDHHRFENSSDDSHNNVALEKMEHFVQGETGDFSSDQSTTNRAMNDHKLNQMDFSKNDKDAENRKQSLEKGKEAENSEEANEYGTIKEDNEWQGSGEMIGSKTSKEFKQHLKEFNSSDESKNDDQGNIFEGNRNPESQTIKEFQQDVESPKESKAVFSKEQETKNPGKQGAESEQIALESKETEEPINLSKFKNSQNSKEDDNSDRPKPVKVDRKLNDTATFKDSSNKTLSQDNGPNKETEEFVVKNGPGLHNGEPAKGKFFVDTQEEFPEDIEKTDSKSNSKTNHQQFTGENVDGLSDVSEMFNTFNAKNKEDSPVTIENVVVDKNNVGSCKRYKVMKNGKKIKVKVKKGCIEKASVKKQIHEKLQPLPDTTEAVTALSMNPGYSTLPGAESKPATHEVSYYFDNKDKSNLPSFKDNVYSDGASSNVYDQGDYVNTAESILRKDVRDAYNTANDILNAEEAMDKSKTIRRKKTIFKRSKRVHPREQKIKRTKLNNGILERTNYLDNELNSNSFRW